MIDSPAPKIMTEIFFFQKNLKLILRIHISLFVNTNPELKGIGCKTCGSKSATRGKDVYHEPKCGTKNWSNLQPIKS